MVGAGGSDQIHFRCAAYTGDFGTERLGDLHRFLHLAPLPDQLRQLSRIDQNAHAAPDAAQLGPLIECVAEATRDLGAPVVVVLAASEDRLQLVVSGSDPVAAAGTDADRVEAAGGSVSTTGDNGHTVIEVQMPAPAQ